MRYVTTGDAPAPAGHYSQGVVYRGLVHVSGQLPIDPLTGSVLDGTVAAQVERTLRNVEAVLLEAGSGLEHVVSMTVFVVARDDWAEVNAACEAIFGSHRPARAVIGGALLKPGCRVEITAIGAIPDRP
ncbi:MAG: RidA family protein [Gemmatimonadales bacterium]|nr:RidA family protein [Gemmatimonadales bacterium]